MMKEGKNKRRKQHLNHHEMSVILDSYIMTVLTSSSFSLCFLLLNPSLFLQGFVRVNMEGLL